MTKARSTAIAGIAAAALATAGCASDGSGGIDRRTLGTGIGAAAGVALGSAIGAGGGRTAAMIVGGLVGAVIGSEFARALDERDQALAEANAQDALERYPSGSTSTWENPDNRTSGAVTPEPPFRGSDGEVCREYTQTITIDGRGETARGVACRNPDGTWRIVNA